MTILWLVQIFWILFVVEWINYDSFVKLFVPAADLRLNWATPVAKAYARGKAGDAEGCLLGQVGLHAY